MNVCRSLPIVLLLLLGCSDTDRLRIFASMGNAEAQSALGARYRDGKGVPQDRGQGCRVVAQGGGGEFCL